jgi:competence protein ComEA
MVVAVVCLSLPFAPMARAAVAQAPVVSKVEAVVNLNTASVKELQSLPGIGKVTAERIVAFRTEQGTFVAPEDLLKVKGVGKQTLEKIRGQITVK